MCTPVDSQSATTNFINVILKLLKLFGCLFVSLENEVHKGRQPFQYPSVKSLLFNIKFTDQSEVLNVPQGLR